MKVFKFGGASVNTVDRIKNVASILKHYPNQELVIVVSAIGKTTNALEKVAEHFFAKQKEEALSLFEGIKSQHLQYAKYLLIKEYIACESQLKDFFTEVEWLLHDNPVREFDYYYDQIVCVGELLSTCLISHFLREEEITNEWVDIRDWFRTNNQFRNASIDWDYTAKKISSEINSLLQKNGIVITQGFIGATDENESTTLGREGSDYTAAVFANILEAESVTIWKDVENVMNADPKKFEDAIALPELSYSEVIEMAYYGAQVIHPKTIKPLQNKNIPLYVKCFLQPNLPGTLIHQTTLNSLPPIIVLKERQVMLTLTSVDFAFFGEENVSKLYELFSKFQIQPNLTQNGAISFTAVLDDFSDKIEKLAIAAASYFEVQLRKELTLLTIRHYNESILTEFLQGKTPLLKQQTHETVQVLWSEQ